MQQRYLVETITMTTVTERRIVREISEEETRPANSNASIDEGDHPAAIESSQNEITPKNGELKSSSDSDKPAELTLAFKLASNSLKPNSAVRQLFPDPRFISPPPAPVKSVSSDLEDSGMDDGENQKLSSDGQRIMDDSSIKRTIERNALRRSLCKYDTGSLKKKSLKSKDLSLEERIRQLTCVDDDGDATDTSVSENNNSGGKLITNHQHHNNNNMMINGMIHGRTIGEGEDHLLMPMHQLPVRTSPSGEERPKGQHHHHHHNSAYKKITDLFGGQKKNNAELNLPDIGLGAKQAMAMKSATQKLSSEARKQFLASLAPLSCVASSGVGDAREDYYRMPSKPGDRNSVGYNSDSSYSLEDIEDALQEGIPAPPDVTRGTPTSTGPSLDSFGQDASDELLAFVEQEKTRTERIKRRYDLVEEKRNCNDNEKNPISTVEDDDEDDELNDYGFNRRPSVRGIKAQFETTNEIVRQLRTRSAAATSLPEACRLNFPSAAAAVADDDSASSSSDMYHLPYGADPSTVSRINSMQKQINEIYQSITEGGVANLMEQPTSRPATSLSYLESTLPRTMIPQDNRHNGSLRMLRMTGGDGTTAPLGVYSTLPKPHRHPAGYSYAVPVATANPAAVQAAAAVAAAGAKCYRTMYFVPYNGMSDPTYQNIQRILPPEHSSSPTNYAEHLERYPYPRNGRIEATGQQQQQARYYVRPASIPVSKFFFFYGG